MFHYFLLLLQPFCSAGQGIAQKQYNLRAKSPNVLLFSALTAFAGLLFFLLLSRLELTFDLRLLPYTIVYGISYAAAWAGTVFAVRYGSMALSYMIISCSLVFPTSYGLMRGEPATPVTLISIVLIFAAIVLVNLKTGGSKDKFSFKWFMWVMIALFANGSCSITQNELKRAFGDSFTNEFMIVSLLIAFIVLLTAARLNSKSLINDLKLCLPYASANGIANALLHLLTLMLIGNIPNTILYPTSSVLSMLLAFLISYFIYKERFSSAQYIGYGLGAVAVVLLNL